MKSSIDLWDDEYKADEWKDDDIMFRIKTNIENLRPMEKKIWMTYVELGSYAATAKECNVSGPTAKSYINRIKDKILC